MYHGLVMWLHFTLLLVHYYLLTSFTYLRLLSWQLSLLPVPFRSLSVLFHPGAIAADRLGLPRAPPSLLYHFLYCSFLIFVFLKFSSYKFSDLLYLVPVLFPFALFPFCSIILNLLRSLALRFARAHYVSLPCVVRSIKPAVAPHVFFS